MSTREESTRPIWNFLPALPVRHAPLFAWPPKPFSLLVWYAKYTINPAISGLAIIAVGFWFWMQAPIARYQSFELGWLLENHLRNLCLMIIVAGGLHLYFYTLNRQGSELKFDSQEFDKNHGRFTFNNQVLDNMFWTLASGVTFWTAWEAILLSSYANNAIPLLQWNESPIWFLLLFPILALWHELYFYFIHRLLHWPPLYRAAHSVHHRNSNTGPWSGISMHPYEHAIYFGSLLIHLVLPTHPVHALFHLYWLALGPAVSHSGYQGVYFKGKLRWATGSFFHQLHHRHFECNYATSCRQRAADV